MNPYAIAVLVIGLLCGGAGFKLGIDHEKAGQLAELKRVEKERDEAQALADQRSIGFENVITYLNGQVRKNQKGLRDALQNPVYRDCKPDPVGLHILNEFIGAANRSRESSGEVSKRGDASGGSEPWRLDAGVR